MLLIIIWMGWRLIPSSCNFLASDDVQAALSLLTPHHDRLPPPRVPDHRVEWTRGRSPSIPSQPQAPQWAPRPPQRRTSQAGFPSVRLSRCRPVLGFKPFLLLLSSKHFLQPIFWDLSFSPLYVHVSPYQFCCSLGGLASYCVWAKMSSTLTLNCRIKVSVRLNACTHRCFQFEIWKCMRR